MEQKIYAVSGYAEFYTTLEDAIKGAAYWMEEANNTEKWHLPCVVKRINANVWKVITLNEKGNRTIRTIEERTLFTHCDYDNKFYYTGEEDE